MLAFLCFPALVGIRASRLHTSLHLQYSILRYGNILFLSNRVVCEWSLSGMGAAMLPRLADCRGERNSYVRRNKRLLLTVSILAQCDHLVSSDDDLSVPHGRGWNLSQDIRYVGRSWS